MTTGKRRPRRANSALDIVRGIRTTKAIYWTNGRLRKLLPGVWSTAREEHFARAVRALRQWPDLPLKRPDPVRLTGGRWAWSGSMVSRMKEYAGRAPADGVDPNKLRETLQGMNESASERFMEMVTEALDGQPEPTDPQIPGAPNASPPSAMGWLSDMGRLFRVRGVWRCD